MSELLLPFQFDFMRSAFLIGTLIAVPTALLSCFLVLKGWALMGDAVSHAVLPGVVLAWMAGVPLLLGAFAAGLFCAVATGWLAENSRVKRDTVMGVVFSGMFGLGLVLYAAIRTDVHLDHILYGNMLGVGRADLAVAGSIGAAVTLLVAAKWRDLLAHAFDPAQARVSGLPVAWLHYGLLAALSATVVATLSAVGLVLAIGLLIAPGAVAFLVVRSFGTMLLAAVAVNVAAMIVGIWLAFHLDAAPAPTVILVLTVAFVVAFGWRLRRNKRLTGSTGGSSAAA